MDETLIKIQRKVHKLPNHTGSIRFKGLQGLEVKVILTLSIKKLDADNVPHRYEEDAPLPCEGV